jgi:hypothetical protein
MVTKLVELVLSAVVCCALAVLVLGMRWIFIVAQRAVEAQQAGLEEDRALWRAALRRRQREEAQEEQQRIKEEQRRVKEERHQMAQDIVAVLSVGADVLKIVLQPRMQALLSFLDLSQRLVREGVQAVASPNACNQPQRSNVAEQPQAARPARSSSSAASKEAGPSPSALRPTQIKIEPAGI